MTPLVKATWHRASDKLVQATAKSQNISLEEARKMLDAEIARDNTWVNEIYQVAVTRWDHPNLGPCMQINIRRRDGKVIFRDWRHFQAIKNQLAGPECEGLEIYPAESRKVDTSNKYHIFCILTADEDHRIPFGWQERDVCEQTADGVNGIRQRPLDASDPESRLNQKK